MCSLYTAAPPSQPHSPKVEGIGATWLLIYWTAPLCNEFPLSRYEVIAQPIDGDHTRPVNISTVDNRTFVNITGLHPETIYNLTVVSVIEVSDIVARSQKSVPIGNIVTISGNVRLNQGGRFV